MLVTLTSIGKSVAYMPYAEATRALEQEAQMHSTAARSASPCRLSPQPGVGAVRSSGPPGKYRSSCLAIHLHCWQGWFAPRTCPCYFRIPFLFLCIPSSVVFSWDSLGHWEVCVHTCILWRWLPVLLWVHVLCENLEIHPLLKNIPVSMRVRISVSQIMQDAKRTYNWLSVISVYFLEL